MRLHALTCLIAQAERLMPLAARDARDARDQELTWTQIAELLNTFRRHGGTPLPEQAMINLTERPATGTPPAGTRRNAFTPYAADAPDSRRADT